MSDDGDGADEGSQSRPEPQLIRSPPVFRKQQRTPLGKTNFFRLTKAEEDAKKRASLDASRELAVTNSQLMEYSMNSIEQARQLASRNGRAELGTRGREERELNKQTIEFFQSSLRQHKLSTMAAIKGGTFIPSSGLDDGLGIYDPNVIAAMDSYAKIGDAFSTSYRFGDDGVSQVEQRLAAASASLPPRLEPNNRGMPKPASSPTGLDATVRSPSRSSSSASLAPISPSHNSAAFGTGGFGSVRGGSALLKGSRSTGSLLSSTGELKAVVVSGGDQVKSHNDLNTTLITTAHIAKSYPQPPKSSMMFKDMPNEDPLRFVDREAVTNADIEKAAARTRAIKFKLCATSPGSFLNNKVYDVDGAQAVRSPVSRSALGRSHSAASLAETAERTESDGGSGPVSIRTTSLVKLAQHQYLPVPAGNGVGIQPVPDLAWDTSVDDRYLPVSTTDMQPAQYPMWGKNDRARKDTFAEQRLQRIHEHEQMVSSRTKEDADKYWAECASMVDTHRNQKMRYDEFIAKKQEEEFTYFDKQYRRSPGEFYRFPTASQGVMPIKSPGFQQYMRDSMTMSPLPEPAFIPPVELFQSTSYYNSTIDQSKLGYDLRLKLASPGPNHPARSPTPGQQEQDEANSDHSGGSHAGSPNTVAEVAQQLAAMQVQQQQQQRQLPRAPSRGGGSKPSTPSGQAHARLFGTSPTPRDSMRSPSPLSGRASPGLHRASTPSEQHQRSVQFSPSPTTYGSAFVPPSPSPSSSMFRSASSGSLRSPSTMSHREAKIVHVMAGIQSPTRGSSLLPFPVNPYVAAWSKPTGHAHSIMVPAGKDRIT